MQLLGFFIVVCVLVSVLRTAIVVLCLVLALLLFWGVLFRPQEMFAFLVLTAVTTFIQTHATAATILIVVSIVASMIAKSDRQPRLPSGSGINQLPKL